ncbi:ABC transporter substrate-binding protein [Acetobacterium woodii]|uniref:Putative ABC transport system substrate binding protein n=1 Tax=Acetobacterium woodii (strain ATCC 29683 / DSM 1030 / JCM 2381 / KCTC 1655 / WB1) TaxID=931626 RepID=H6LE79_ACEWD|nr:ABC transporter substrate-binding protein [Acetobacterium woodii]AFA49312.1 putative ABC transport system substrate binding protein [Acetobacterium woodii DSM 1030]
MLKKVKNKKWLMVLSIMLVVALGLSACQTKAADPQTVKVGTLAGPTGMGMAEMIVNGVDLGENVTTEFTVAGAPEQLTAGVISGDFQIAALPSNLAAVLFNKTEGAVVLGSVNTLGVLYIVADENAGVTSIADLKGKTIVASGQGSTPEYVLNYLLQKNGLTPGVDVTINYVAEHSEVVTQLAAGQASIALLPEPFVTTITSKKPNIKVAVDLSKAWEEANAGSQLEMTALVVNKEWAQANPKVFDKFMESYHSSIDSVNNNPAEGAKNIVAAGIMTDAVLAEKAIPNCNIVFIPAKEAKKSLNDYYTILADFEPKAVGGKVPGDDFYILGQ